MDTSSMTHVPAGRARARKPRTPGDPFTTVLRRLRWPVVVAWILAIVLLHGLSSGLSKVTNDGASAYLPASAASTKSPCFSRRPSTGQGSRRSTPPSWSSPQPTAA